MSSKYDTNPLDPDFPEKARAVSADEGETRALPYSGATTQAFPQSAITEEQTRRFNGNGPEAFVPHQQYQPPFNGSHYSPGQHAPMGFAADHSISRKVEGLGLPENILVAAPYFPWYLGMVAGILILLMVPKSETKVRFHAAQGLAAHIGILIVTTILGLVGNVTGFAQAGNVIFQIVTTIMLLVFAFKAWKGRPVHIESVDSLTNWLDEKIDPKAIGK
jgi:uncharacterized membrane protein